MTTRELMHYLVDADPEAVLYFSVNLPAYKPAHSLACEVQGVSNNGDQENCLFFLPARIEFKEAV